MKNFLLVVMLFGAFGVYAQSPLTPSKDDFAQHLTDRLFHLKGDTAAFLFSSWKPYHRQEIADLVRKYASDDPKQITGIISLAMKQVLTKHFSKSSTEIKEISITIMDRTSGCMSIQYYIIR